MAVSTKNPSSFRIKLDCGMGENGKSIIRSKTFTNVKHDATIDNIDAVANALIGLQDHDRFELMKIDYTSISE